MSFLARFLFLAGNGGCNNTPSLLVIETVALLYIVIKMFRNITSRSLQSFRKSNKRSPGGFTLFGCPTIKIPKNNIGKEQFIILRRVVGSIC